MISAFDKYQEVISANEQVFFNTFTSAHDFFDRSFAVFDQLIAQIGTNRDKNGKSHISLLPFLFIFQRQSLAAYNAIASFQSYLAWINIRPGIESALIIGKWVDDPNNANIWQQRFEDQKSYQNTYSGARLRSKSLPQSDQIQGALKEINDRFVHPNPDYYGHHLTMTDLPEENILIRLECFDDDIDVRIGFYGILHLIAVVQDSLAEMFSKMFPSSDRIDTILSEVERKLTNRVKQVGSEHAEALQTLTCLGLWKDL